MKYIFLTTKKAFIESSFELQKCGISMRETFLFEIKNVPQEWAIEHLTKKAYNDVYLNKATFDDDLRTESLRRLYNIIYVFKYILKNDIGECIIVENIRDFCRTYSQCLRNTVETYIKNNRGTDILFLEDSYKINYSHYKYGGDSFKQNEYIYKVSQAFYINPIFIKKFLETQSIFYKPFEYTLNDTVNQSQIMTFFIHKDLSDINESYTYRYTIVVNSGKILLTVLGFSSLVLVFNKYKK
jgi:hypothetical protein